MASNAALDELWVRMCEAYGDHWTKHFGLTPNDTWRAGLDDLDDDDLAAGCLAVVRGESAFPPTLPEFRRYCVQAARRRVHQALPKPEVLPELSAEERAANLQRLADMRAELQRNLKARRRTRTVNAEET